MQDQYFIFISDTQRKEGPYLKDELFGKITPSTLVWMPGMADWKKAKDFEELKYLLMPEIPDVQSKIKDVIKDGTIKVKEFSRKDFSLFFIIIGLIGVGFFVAGIILIEPLFGIFGGLTVVISYFIGRLYE